MLKAIIGICKYLKREINKPLFKYNIDKKPFLTYEGFIFAFNLTTFIVYRVCLFEVVENSIFFWGALLCHMIGFLILLGRTLFPSPNFSALRVSCMICLIIGMFFIA